MSHRFPKPDHPLDILIICTGNICRSPMAEGLLKSMWPGGRNRPPFIHSAGTHAVKGLPAEPYAVEAAGELGADLSVHRSKPATPGLIAGSDLVITMTRQQMTFIQHLAASGSESLRMLCGRNEAGEPIDVPDPYGASLGAYRRCAQMILGCLERLIADLTRK